ncbi:50S ribosomal protein L34e [Candidatus Woesearchaeota archaeon CG10_big_fil_rev_8_21_14_0_10_34_12]|nr:MAG: 50S ribosomal protein L34e [Candidatus Woesearchaeota archaeon CG10_big_fil_rev_8_21_14_0_10_34_12]
MVAPNKRSRSKRRVFVKTPGSKNKIQYRQRKPKLGRCPVTGQLLKGVPRGTSSKMKNLPKTKKRPQRPYGGVLSSQAARRLIIKEARNQ